MARRTNRTRLAVLVGPLVTLLVTAGLALTTSAPAQAGSVLYPGLDDTFRNSPRAAPDPSFSGHAIGLTSDGKIIVGGSVASATGTDLALVRYLPDGLVDTTFGTGGVAKAVVGRNAAINALRIRNDGTIVAVGRVSNDVDNADGALLLARFSAAGALDATFGTGGFTTTDLGATDDNAAAFAFQQSGEIVVAGTAQVGGGPSAATDMVLAAYTAGGALDATFGTNGITRVDFGGTDDSASALVVRADDSIVLAGGRSQVTLSNTTYDGRFALAGFDPAGSLDTAFGTSGLVTTPIGFSAWAGAIVEAANGALVVGGTAASNSNPLYPQYHMAFVRYSAAGAVDTTFGTAGVTTVAMLASYGEHQTSYERVESLETQPDGKLVAVGPWFDFARLTVDGALDATFQHDGILHAPYAQATPFAVGSVLQPDGKILAAGANTVVRVYGRGPHLTLVGPTRLLDTRLGVKPPDGSITRIETGHPGAEAALVNITLANSTANSFVSANACSRLNPSDLTYSNANATVQRVRSNLAAVDLDPDGALCIYTQSSTDLIVDLQGVLSPTGALGLVPITPVRVLDTRNGLPTAARSLTRVATGAPAGTPAVAINLTTTQAQVPGYVAIVACNATLPPSTSNANANLGEDRANTAIVAVDGNGELCVYTETPMHVIVDVLATFSATGGYALYPFGPQRIYDSRHNTITPGPVGPGLVRGYFGTPAGPHGGLVNVTTTDAAAPGYVTVTGGSLESLPPDTEPAASTVNFGAGLPAANLSLVTGGSTISAVYASTPTQLILDVQLVY